MIRGIGPVYAKRMVKMFGKDVFDLIEAEPASDCGRSRASDRSGLTRSPPPGPIRKSSARSWCFCTSHGVGTARAVRIFKTYGVDAVQVMSENPYRLARDIRGIGFRTADLIAEKLGIEKTAMIRVRAGISYALTEAMGNGHCGLPLAELIPLAIKLLEVPDDLIRTAIELEMSEGTVTAEPVAIRRASS